MCVTPLWPYLLVVCVWYEACVLILRTPDWYGSPPANESLTAYGLLEFQDMKEVYPVEEALIERIKSTTHTQTHIRHTQQTHSRHTDLQTQQIHNEDTPSR